MKIILIMFIIKNMINFIDTKTTCKSCNKNIDLFDYRCSKCGEKNNDFPLKEHYKNMIFLSPIKELILFLTGWLFFQIFASFIVYPIFETLVAEEALSSTVNFVSYGLLFIILFLIIFKDIVKIRFNFLNKETYIFAFVTLILLLGLSIGYNSIIKAIFGSNGNANQDAVNSSITSYPVLSLIVFGIVGPICEEITYRLGLFSLLRRKNQILAHILSAVIFGLIHFSFKSIGTDKFLYELAIIPCYMLMGALLNLCYERYGFVSSTLAHILNNSLPIILTLLQSSLQME